MKKFYSNGKLLLTGEYFVLDGAKSLALPTSCGQDLTVNSNSENQLIWNSITNEGNCWLNVIFDLPNLRLVSATFDSSIDGGSDLLAEKLRTILLEARNLNPKFLNSKEGITATTKLTFPRNWGLGTSSTLINNIANWAKINPYKLLEKTFGGSGYDIACAQNNSAITYIKNDFQPKIDKVKFNPIISDNLYFVYLNKKQNSREGIKKYRENKNTLTSEIESITKITDAFLNCENLKTFEELVVEHEKIVSKSIKLKPVQESLFPDYFGKTKSLGAWGGDFILATGNSNSKKYFEKKGFEIVIPFKEIIL